MTASWHPSYGTAEVSFFGGPWHDEHRALPMMRHVVGDGPDRYFPPQEIVVQHPNFAHCANCGGLHVAAPGGPAHREFIAYRLTINDRDDGPVFVYRWVGPEDIGVLPPVPDVVPPGWSGQP